MNADIRLQVEAARRELDAVYQQVRLELLAVAIAYRVATVGRLT